MNKEHWLLYTSDREHGGMKIEGIFDTEYAAWAFYHNSITDDYYTIPHVEGWQDNNKIEREWNG